MPNIILDKNSFSQYSTFMTCPKKYYWSYVRDLVPAEEYKALADGKAFAQGCDGKINDNIWSQVGAIANSKAIKLPGYKTEQRMEYDLGDGVTLVSIADGVSDSHIVEWKLTSRATPENVQAHSLSLQLRLECIAFSKPALLLRMVKKTQIRLKKTETDIEFQKRILEVYNTEWEQHYLEVEVPIIKEGAVAEFLHTMNAINTCRNKNLWPKAAPYACCGMTNCVYLGLCADETAYLPLFREKTNV